MIADIVIRDGGPADADVVAEIAVEAWQPIYEHARETLGPELFSYLHTDWEGEKARQVRRACEADTAGEVLVATLDRVVIAFVSFSQRAPEVGEIGNNAVRPDYQSRGIATRLYEAALDKLRAAGMLYVSVSTGGDPAHAPARRAYEKVASALSCPALRTTGVCSLCHRDRHKSPATPVWPTCATKGQREADQLTRHTRHWRPFRRSRPSSD